MGDHSHYPCDRNYIITWLSDVEPFIIPGSSTDPTVNAHIAANLSTPSSTTLKRKRTTSSSSKGSRKRLNPKLSLSTPRIALSHLDSNMAEQCFRSVQGCDDLPLDPTVPHTPSSSFHTASLDSNSSTTSPAPKSQNHSVESTELRFPKTIHNIRLTLADHGMYFENTEAFTKYPDFVKMINGIVVGERESAFRPESLDRFSKWLKKNATRPEQGLMWQLMPKIMKDNRTITAETDNPSLSNCVVVDFDDDDIIANINIEFTGRLLPSWKPDYADAIAKKLAKTAGMTNPKPDFVYGIREGCFPPPNNETLSEHLKALIGVVPGMIHPFLLVEGKSCAGGAADAENQAIRGGATLVRARRELHARALLHMKAEPEGPDVSSFIFSCTITPQVATIWVHWCHHAGSVDTYHMNKVSDHLLSRHNELINLRRDLHNIMDWGGLTRLESNKKLVSDLFLAEKIKASLASRPKTNQPSIAQNAATSGKGQKKRKVDNGFNENVPHN